MNLLKAWFDGVLNLLFRVMNIFQLLCYEIFNLCVFMTCRGLLKVQYGPKKEYNVSPKGTNRQVEPNNTQDFHISTLPLSIIV